MNRKTRRSLIGALTLWCVFFAVLPRAHAQTSPQAQGPQGTPVHERRYAQFSVADAVAKVNSGDFGLVFIDVIGQAHAVEAIPALKQQFGRSKDWMEKAKIAAVLLKMGEHDGVYWDYLLNEAKVALDSGVPTVFASDSDGNTTGVTPEFEAWLASRKPAIDPSEAYQNAMYMYPGRVVMLGSSEDARAIPYLRQGLVSKNVMIQIASAQGLAQIGDSDSVPLIVAACQKAPKAGQMLIAESLVYFDSEAAQKAVDQYMPAELAKYKREEKASGKKTKPYDTYWEDTPAAKP